MDPRSIRTHCGNCESPRLRWFDSANEMIAALPAAKRTEARKGLKFAGGWGDGYICENCDNFGFFGPVSTGGLI